MASSFWVAGVMLSSVWPAMKRGRQRQGSGQGGEAAGHRLPRVCVVDNQWPLEVAEEWSAELLDRANAGASGDESGGGHGSHRPDLRSMGTWWRWWLRRVEPRRIVVRG